MLHCDPIAAQVQALALDSIILNITAFLEIDAIYPWLVAGKNVSEPWRAQQGNQANGSLRTHVRHFMHRDESWQWLLATGYVPSKQTCHVAARHGFLHLLDQL